MNVVPLNLKLDRANTRLHLTQVERFEQNKTFFRSKTIHFHHFDFISN